MLILLYIIYIMLILLYIIYIIITMIIVFLILYNNMISILYNTSSTGVFFLMSTGSAFQSLGALAANDLSP